ncbi:uncharacterized protein LOC111519487 [Drosophila willistoni]|uniref:uncharacterized protein LOC111519487 n=1 Tax=Drosophila willistoni TaxID=7260 RepID=UPI001F07AEEB|nr:uncharacterized protein LOC111519487 [Drosophila willistoni]
MRILKRRKHNQNQSTMANLKFNVESTKISTLRRFHATTITEGLSQFQDYCDSFKDKAQQRILGNLNSLEDFANLHFFVSIEELFFPPMSRINSGKDTERLLGTSKKIARTGDIVKMLTIMAVALDSSKRINLYSNLLSTKDEFNNTSKK